MGLHSERSRHDKPPDTADWVSAPAGNYSTLLDGATASSFPYIISQEDIVR